MSSQHVECGEPHVERMDLRPLEAGRTVAGAVCLRRKVAGTTRDGKSFLTVEVGNSTGSVSAKIWSEGVGAWDGLEPGAPVHIAGRLKEGWKGGAAELVVTSVGPLPTPHPIQLELNPIAPVPLVELTARFDHLVGYLSSAGETLLRVVLRHVGEENYWTAPAARGYHHACVRGLVWHSTEVAECSLALARATGAGDMIDVDALVVGALLHDVAKVHEYQWRGVPIDVSRHGLLTYHTSNGGVITMLAAERARDELASAGVTQQAIEHLVHVQLSHHGVPEFGSPVEPRTLEALLIHHADNASAKVRAMLDDVGSAPADADGWVAPAGWNRKPVLHLRSSRSYAATISPQGRSMTGRARHGDAQDGGSGNQSMPECSGGSDVLVLLRVQTEDAHHCGVPDVEPTHPSMEDR